MYPVFSIKIIFCCVWLSLKLTIHQLSVGRPVYYTRMYIFKWSIENHSKHVLGIRNGGAHGQDQNSSYFLCEESLIKVVCWRELTRILLYTYLLSNVVSLDLPFDVIKYFILTLLSKLFLRWISTVRNPPSPSCFSLQHHFISFSTNSSSI